MSRTKVVEEIKENIDLDRYSVIDSDETRPIQIFDKLLNQPVLLKQNIMEVLTVETLYNVQGTILMIRAYEKEHGEE